MLCFVPSMLLTHFDHGGKDIIPGLLLHHDIIREHTSIPANMFECFGKFAILIPQPVTRIFGNINFHSDLLPGNADRFYHEILFHAQFHHFVPHENQSSMGEVLS